MRNKKLIGLLIVVSVLVILVIVCGATFLVRDVNAYSYYNNSELETYHKNVIAAAGIKKNSSMFFVDEAEVKSKVEKAYPDVEVINVKRSFPDKVTINYVIHEKMFQYSKVVKDDGEDKVKYYQCYASGKIGSVSDEPASGYFTIKPSASTSSAVGDYFQSSDGKDRQYLDTIIRFLRARDNDEHKIKEFIDFIDFRRAGYVYIRTNAGCSIEIHDNGGDFTALLERGYAIYVNLDPTLTDISKASGLIKVYPNFSEYAESPISSVYVKPDAQGDYTDEGYYSQYYEQAKQPAI